MIELLGGLIVIGLLGFYLRWVFDKLEDKDDWADSE